VFFFFALMHVIINAKTRIAFMYMILLNP